MSFGFVVFFVCLIAAGAYFVYIKQKERELIEQVTPIFRGEWSERRVIMGMKTKRAQIMGQTR